MVPQLAVPATVAELGADRFDVFRLSRQKLPSRAGVERIGERLEHLRRIVLGIDAQRNKEDIATQSVAQLVLHLRQPRRLDRAEVRATCVNKADHHDPALDQIVVEAQGLAILGDDRSVGEIIRVPGVSR